MAWSMNVKAFVRKYGRQPNHLFNHENKPHRKQSNREHRKKVNAMVRRIDLDWDAVALPPTPKTSGWLTI